MCSQADFASRIQSFPELLFQCTYQERMQLSWHVKCSLCFIPGPRCVQVLVPVRAHTCLKFRQNMTFCCVAAKPNAHPCFGLEASYTTQENNLISISGIIGGFTKIQCTCLRSGKNELQIWIMSEADPSP